MVPRASKAIVQPACWRNFQHKVLRSLLYSILTRPLVAPNLENSRNLNQLKI